LEKRVGIIGLGNIGFGMASNLLKAGFQVVACDLRQEVVKALEKKGAVIAANAGAVGKQCSVVFSVVLNYPQNLAILEGPEGLLQSMAAGGTIFVCSTISPAQARELAAKAVKHNLRLLDSPVSGGREGAEAGTLALMVGGSRDALEEHRGVLEAVSGNIYHLGDVGMGETAKAINQVLVAVHDVATAEALLLAGRSGIDLKQMFSIINNSAGGSYMFKWRAMRMVDRDFTSHGALKILLKDTNIVFDLAESLGLPMPLTSIARQMFQAGVNQGLGDEDDAAVVKVLEQMAGFSLADAKK
jgi:L-threonate 2-dehydrogenase